MSKMTEILEHSRAIVNLIKEGAGESIEAIKSKKDGQVEVHTIVIDLSELCAEADTDENAEYFGDTTAEDFQVVDYGDEPENLAAEILIDVEEPEMLAAEILPEVPEPNGDEVANWAR